jgi:arginase
MFYQVFLRVSEQAAEYGTQPLPRSLRTIDLSEVRRVGAEAAARDALAHLIRDDGPNGFWVHLDADVLDDNVMPAVDYRMPGGLSWAELAAVLQETMNCGRTVGLDLTIFNPHFDPDRWIARGLAETIGRGLSG